MSRRSRAREVVLQLLYQDDMNADRRLSADDEFMRERLEGDIGLVDFAWDLLRGVRSKRREIDAALSLVAANWSLERMAVTDRNALRIGGYEILYGQTPDRVAVNEAVELAKRFGAAQSAPFVNGVLDRMMHDRRPASPQVAVAVIPESDEEAAVTPLAPKRAPLASRTPLSKGARSDVAESPEPREPPEPPDGTTEPETTA